MIIYQAQVNADSTEGRGPMITVGFFTNRFDAERAVKGQGVMGVGDGKVKEATVYGSYDEWRDATDPDYKLYLQLKARYEKR